MPEQPLAGTMCRHRPKVAAVDAWHPVVPRQPLIEEGRLRRQQLHHPPVLPHVVVKQQLRLPPERLAQVVVELGKRVDVRGHRPHVPQMQPLPGKVGCQRPGARIGQHPSHFRLQHRRVAQAARPRCIEQHVVREAAPQKERQPRGELQVRQAVGRPRFGVDGVGDHPIEEVRIDQNPFEPPPDAHLEAVTLRPAGPENAEQCVEVGVGQRAPVRAAADRREYLGGAGLLVLTRGRLQLKIRCRLGDAPSPVTPNGPSISIRPTRVSAPRTPANSTLVTGRLAGARPSGAAMRSMKVTPSRCGPAVTDNRTSRGTCFV